MSGNPLTAVRIFRNVLHGSDFVLRQIGVHAPEMCCAGLIRVTEKWSNGGGDIGQR